MAWDVRAPLRFGPSGTSFAADPRQLQFAKEGVKLILWDVNEAANRETEQILRSMGYEDV